MISVTVQIDHNSEIPLHRQIADGIERALDSGQLRRDRNLPSVRELSSRLSVSPATVSAAYRELVARRIVEARARSGYRAAAEAGREERALGRATRADGVPYPLHRIEPNLIRHPAAEFGRLVAEAAAEGTGVGGYEDYRGFGPLREALADLLRADGVAAEAERGILVTNGAQHAIALAARTAGPSARIAMEDPAYPGARLAFQAAGAEIVPIPMTDQGPDVAALEAAAARGRIDLFYCCPAYGNPTGRSWSAEARERVLAAAARWDVTILEDDYLGDLDYLGEGLPLLAALAPKAGARVIHVRTFSKCLLPALRIAAVSAAPETIDRLLPAKTVDDICGSSLLQRPLARYLAEGRYRRHLEAVRPHYRAVREAVRARAAAGSGGIVYDDPPGGLCLLGTLPAGVDVERFSDACRAEGALVSPGPSYWARESEGAGRFRIGFGCLEIDEADGALSAIERALERTRSGEREGFFRRALL